MQPGDNNADQLINVLDIVMLMDFILGNQTADDLQFAIADINVDGLLNVLDVVMIMDIVLGNGLARGTTAHEATFYYGNDLVSYKSDGNIAGIQFEVTGEYEINQTYLPEGWKIDNNETTIILFSMDGSTLENNKLFSYEGDLLIESIIAADWYGSEVISSSIILPKEFALSPAYPNPFNPVTTIKFAVADNVDVSLIIYDLQGREVIRLLDRAFEAGYHSVVWNADRYPSGMYFTQMVAGGYVKTQKLMLVK